MLTRLSKWVPIALAGLAHGHQAFWHDAMYCRNGTTPGVDDPNNSFPAHPLYMLTYAEYWFHGICKNFPPLPGVFLDIPAGGTIQGEIAGNRRDTTLDGTGAVLTDWGDGLNHPDDYHDPNCITSPNLHCTNQSTAAGTAFAIAYGSDPDKVTLEEFTVFAVTYHTPWKRVVEYQVPSGMPPCGPDGCLCLWVWVAYHCGEPNIYMHPYKCRVIPDGSSPRTIGKPQPPKYCEEDPTQCVSGAKQPVVWNQIEGNNIEVVGLDRNGLPKVPVYNEKCGFRDGAQNDIFEDSVSNGNITASGPQVVSDTPTPSPASDPGSGLPTSTPASGTPSSSGTPSAVPTSDPSGPGTPSSDPTCQLPTPVAHSKRMLARRASHNIF